ncbi:MAG: hypothetical protein ACON5H_09445 [Akkermansiaceae bacterium]
MKAQTSVSLRRGFALIATISVLILLTLIAVAFLSLSAVTVSSSRIEWAEEEARANARLALMIAIGELQREMGPDQRVSATATILDDTPDSVEVSRSSVNQPHWLGVWSTNWGEASGNSLKGPKDPDELTPWERDPEKGDLKDRRYSEGWDREANISTWLVSGNEGGRRRALKAGRQFYEADDAEKKGDFTDNKLDIVSIGSVDDPEDIVSVKAVNVERELRRPDGKVSYTAVGRYAYWISSNSAKANLSLVDRHADEQPNPQSEEGFQRIFHANDNGEEAISGIGDISDDEAGRIVSAGTIELTQGADRQDVKRLYHDITAHSRSVLTNVRDGGLQKDFSVFLTETGDIQNVSSQNLNYIGLSETDRLVGPPNSNYEGLQGIASGRFEQSSPQFGIFKNWMADAKAKKFRVSTDELDLKSEKDLLPELGEFRRDQRWDVYDRLLGESGEPNRGVEHTQLDQVTMAPVVVEASLYYNLATRRTSRTVNGERKSMWSDIICLYPRVSLWNPYNVKLKVPPMIMQMFVNGNKQVEITFEDGQKEMMYLGFGGGNPGGNGNCFFLLAGSGKGSARDRDLVEMEPGETLVYTVDLNRSQRQGNLRGDYSKTNYMNNLLTPYNAASPDRYLTVERVVDPNPRNKAQDRFFGVATDWSSCIRQYNEWTDASKINVSKPISFREEPAGSGNSTQSGGDNFQFMLKDATGQSRANHGWHHGNPGSNQRDGNLHLFPMIAVGNISLQAGGGDELPLRWANSVTHPVYEIPVQGGALRKNGTNGHPNPRTRDGFRLRWWEEHPSNIANTTRLAGKMTNMLQTAGIGNWNVRASYSLRTPFENVGDKPPYFSGNYMRDLPDDAVSWDALLPISQGGKETGFPFGPPNSPFNEGPVVLFEVPSENIGIPNLAYLRNMKLSEYAWHPTYPIGNSLADPRVEMTGTSPDMSEFGLNNGGGWNRSSMGDRSGGRDGREYFPALHRELIGFVPETDTVVYDMSYEVNFNLWDTYHISSNLPTKSRRSREMARFVDDPVENALANSRLGLFDRPDLETSVLDDLNDFFRAAAHLSLEGGFDVNSTSVEAWKALLSSTKDVKVEDSSEAVFPRFLRPDGNMAGNEGVTIESLTGNRELSDSEVQRLAEEIVAQVKKRAPFFGMADFVNRRLSPDIELARAGAIETALSESGVNSSYEQPPLEIEDRESDLPDYALIQMKDATKIDHTMKPKSQAWGIPGYLTQGDVLGVIGSSLSARSDTFTIRSYGESRDVNGRVLARAWCEATLQRTPEPVNPDEIRGGGINPAAPTGDEVDFGRRFKVVGFRWLGKDEV